MLTWPNSKILDLFMKCSTSISTAGDQETQNTQDFLIYVLESQNERLQQFLNFWEIEENPAIPPEYSEIILMENDKVILEPELRYLMDSFCQSTSMSFISAIDLWYSYKTHVCLTDVNSISYLDDLLQFYASERIAMISIYIEIMHLYNYAHTQDVREQETLCNPVFPGIERLITDIIPDRVGFVNELISLLCDLPTPEEQAKVLELLVVLTYDFVRGDVSLINAIVEVTKSNSDNDPLMALVILSSLRIEELTQQDHFIHDEPVCLKSLFDLIEKWDMSGSNEARDLLSLGLLVSVLKICEDTPPEHTTHTHADVVMRKVLEVINLEEAFLAFERMCVKRESVSNTAITTISHIVFQLCMTSIAYFPDMSLLSYLDSVIMLLSVVFRTEPVCVDMFIDSEQYEKIENIVLGLFPVTIEPLLNLYMCIINRHTCSDIFMRLAAIQSFVVMLPSSNDSLTTVSGDDLSSVMLKRPFKQWAYTFEKGTTGMLLDEEILELLDLPRNVVPVQLFPMGEASIFECIIDCYNAQITNKNQDCDLRPRILSFLAVCISYCEADLRTQMIDTILPSKQFRKFLFQVLQSGVAENNKELLSSALYLMSVALRTTMLSHVDVEKLTRLLLSLIDMGSPEILSSVLKFMPSLIIYFSSPRAVCDDSSMEMSLGFSLTTAADITNVETSANSTNVEKLIEIYETLSQPSFLQDIQNYFNDSQIFTERNKKLGLKTLLFDSLYLIFRVAYNMFTLSLQTKGDILFFRLCEITMSNGVFLNILLQEVMLPFRFDINFFLIQNLNSADDTANSKYRHIKLSVDLLVLSLSILKLVLYYVQFSFELSDESKQGIVHTALFNMLFGKRNASIVRALLQIVGSELPVAMAPSLMYLCFENLAIIGELSSYFDNKPMLLDHLFSDFTMDSASFNSNLDSGSIQKISSTLVLFSRLEDSTSVVNAAFFRFLSVFVTHQPLVSLFLLNIDMGQKSYFSTVIDAFTDGNINPDFLVGFVDVLRLFVSNAYKTAYRKFVGDIFDAKCIEFLTEIVNMNCASSIAIMALHTTTLNLVTELIHFGNNVKNEFIVKNFSALLQSFVESDMSVLFSGVTDELRTLITDLPEQCYLLLSSLPSVSEQDPENELEDQFAELPISIAESQLLSTKQNRRKRRFTGDKTSTTLDDLVVHTPAKQMTRKMQSSMRMSHSKMTASSHVFTSHLASTLGPSSAPNEKHQQWDWPENRWFSPELTLLQSEDLRSFDNAIFFETVVDLFAVASTLDTTVFGFDSVQITNFNTFDTDYIDRQHRLAEPWLLLNAFIDVHENSPLFLFKAIDDGYKQLLCVLRYMNAVDRMLYIGEKNANTVRKDLLKMLLEMLAELGHTLSQSEFVNSQPLGLRNIMSSLVIGICDTICALSLSISKQHCEMCSIDVMLPTLLKIFNGFTVFATGTGLASVLRASIDVVRLLQRKTVTTPINGVSEMLESTLTVLRQLMAKSDDSANMVLVLQLICEYISLTQSSLSDIYPFMASNLVQTISGVGFGSSLKELTITVINEVVYDDDDTLKRLHSLVEAMAALSKSEHGAQFIEEVGASALLIGAPTLFVEDIRKLRAKDMMRCATVFNFYAQMVQSLKYPSSSVLHFALQQFQFILKGLKLRSKIIHMNLHLTQAIANFVLGIVVEPNHSIIDALTINNKKFFPLLSSSILTLAYQIVKVLFTPNDERAKVTKIKTADLETMLLRLLFTTLQYVTTVTNVPPTMTGSVSVEHALFSGSAAVFFWASLSLSNPHTNGPPPVGMLLAIINFASATLASGSSSFPSSPSSLMRRSPIRSPSMSPIRGVSIAPSLVPNKHSIPSVGTAPQLTKLTLNCAECAALILVRAVRQYEDAKIIANTVNSIETLQSCVEDEGSTDFLMSLLTILKSG
ncbi:hypothetical protein PCE1_003188 [Barthelona sp. PCE]